MDPFVFAAVLFAAACHAGWNAAIKGGNDTVSTTSLIAIGAGAVAFVILPFVGLPLPPAWPWVIASVVIHLLYFIGLSESYRVGDLGQVYPIARGTAPLMTAALSAPLIGEALGLVAWIGIAALAGGVLLLSARGGRETEHFPEKACPGLDPGWRPVFRRKCDHRKKLERDTDSIKSKRALARFDRHATGLALFTATTICAYSLVDGVGARLAGSPHAYTASLFVGNAVALAAYGVARRRKEAFPALAAYWKIGLAGGALQLLSYGIAIWAMTVAPIAIVAALRESSVLFGTALAVVFLKEPLRPIRLVAALMIVCGLMLIRLY
jgi:drug/metabolite transporter (DMT)-like permease